MNKCLSWRTWSRNPRTEFCSRVHYSFLRPVTGIGNDHREAIDRATPVFVDGNHCKCVPLEQGPARKLETIAGFHGAVFEAEADNTIRKDFRVDIAEMKL